MAYVAANYTDRLHNELCAVPWVDGRPLQCFELTSDRGLKVLFTDVGGTWLSCQVPRGPGAQEVLLGHSRAEHLYDSGAYCGASVGRYANRIRRGRLRYQGREYQLDTNEGRNTLHGGSVGMDRSRWSVEGQAQDSLVLRVRSADGEMGFPGNLTVTLTIRLQGLAIIAEYQATTDLPTPVNLTLHPYFNLSDATHGEDVRDHLLQVTADRYLPVDEENLPANDPRPVASSGYDFRLPRPLRDGPPVLDHGFLLDKSAGTAAATLQAPNDSLMLHLSTSKPGLQVYSGAGLAGVAGRFGHVYPAYAGLALESQFLADSPNHPHWPQPDCWLQPGATYAYTTRYEFSGL
ncbi:MAG: galactose-1-epimerase [Pseudomonadota bacterium]